MLLAWTINIFKKTTLALLVFALIFLATRVPRIWNDTINPDAVNWHYRTQQFVNGLKYQQFAKTYQHYHPGVTMMWLTGISTEAFKQLTGIRDYDIYNFGAFDVISKMVLIFAQLVLSIYLIFLLRKYFGIWGSIFMVSMFTFEPFFVGNSRLYHLDVLFSLLLFSGLVTGFLAYERNSGYYYLATGVLLALAFLTKSVGIVGIGFYGAWFIYKICRQKTYKLFTKLLLTVGVFCLATFVLFPALWVDPVYYITEIFTESERIGLRNGHQQLVFGEPTTEASIWFYMIALLLKTSPFMLFGLVLSMFYTYRLDDKYKKQINRGFLLYLITFALVYLVGMSLASKKIDRYILPLYPFMAIASYYGYLALTSVKNFKTIIALMGGLFVVYPLFTFFPYYFTYTNPLMGNAVQANSIIGQKPFGVGMYDLKDYIVAHYGAVKLGFIDTKPIESIYPHSKVRDIRLYGAGEYDLVVLGINENFDGTKLQDDSTFQQDSSLYINGLEYWRIYAKQK